MSPRAIGHLAIAATLSASTVLPVPANAQMKYCENPALAPAKIASWTQGLPERINDSACDGTYVFIQDGTTAGVHRYSLDGQTHDFWPLPPGDNLFGYYLAVAPDGDLYASTTDRLLVFDVDGTGVPKTTLFTGPDGSAPGELVAGPQIMDVHPESGDIYVFDQGGIYEGGEESTWVSRIQHFSKTGSFIDILAENLQSLTYGDSLYDVTPPVWPACGEWHYGLRLRLDDDHLYLFDGVNVLGELNVCHKFDLSSGQCVGQWDVTGAAIAIDRNGYAYRSAHNTTITKSMFN